MPIQMKITNGVGFFSCGNVALLEIINHYNKYKGLPDVCDRSEQYAHYKANPRQDLINYYFDQWSMAHIHVPYEGDMPMPYDCMSVQWSPYSKLPFDDWSGIVAKYFSPSQHVANIAYNLKTKYGIDYANTCAIFYRGNDKERETQIAPYADFIKKAKQIKKKNPGIKFLVQPDETEFLEAFSKAFPGSVYFEETPHIKKQDSAVFYQVPKDQRAEYGARFFAAVICISQCEHLITHSGSCGLWAALYRGHANNIHQYFNGQWIM